MRYFSMKIILLINLFSFYSCLAQWFTQTSGVNYAIKCLYFQNNQTGFACSYNVLLKTTNSGNHWEQIPLNGGLNSISFINIYTGYVCGDSGIIYKTTNSGNNWINLSSNTSENLMSVKFADYYTGIVCGKNKTILKTTNGGINWFNIANFAWLLDIYEIKIIDSENYYLSASESFILKTSNGGTNWLIYTHGEPNPLFTIDFINSYTGYATGCCGMFMKTTNAGLNWTKGFYLSLGFSFYSIKFINTLTGYLAGDNGMIYRTTDGGNKWDSTVTNTNETLYSVFMTDHNTGWAAGSGGIILKTTNGGGTGFPIGIRKLTDKIPSDNKFLINYPNPFNSVTSISFYISENSFVELKVFDITCRHIVTLINQNLTCGTYTFNFDGSNLASGVYFYKITAGKFSDTGKMLLIK